MCLNVAGNSSLGVSVNTSLWKAHGPKIAPGICNSRVENCKCTDINSRRDKFKFEVNYSQ